MELTNMDERESELIYSDKGPRFIQAMFFIGFIVSLAWLVYISTGAFRANSPMPDDQYLVFLAFMVPAFVFVLILIPLGLFLYRKSLIYSTGIIPGYRTIRMLSRPDSYFIPYHEIEMIGYRGENSERVLSYFFLMRDGTLAFCTLPETDEGKKILAEQLKKNCPDVEVVQLKLPGVSSGIPIEAMVRRRYGANAPIRYYTP